MDKILSLLSFREESCWNKQCIPALICCHIMHEPYHLSQSKPGVTQPVENLENIIDTKAKNKNLEKTSITILSHNLSFLPVYKIF